MNVFETSVALLGITVLGRMSPGPDMMLLIRYTGLCSLCKHTQDEIPLFSMQKIQQLRPAIACVVGVCLGLCVHISLALLGFIVLLQKSPMIFVVISCLGSVYLIYIGTKSIRFAHNFSLQQFTDIAESMDDTSQTSRFQQSKSAFLDGLLCNLLNPKVALFIVSLFSQFVAPDTPMHIKAFYGALIFGEGFFGWLSFIFLLSTSFMQTLYAKYMLVIERVTGVLFILLGISILVKNIL